MTPPDLPAQAPDPEAGVGPPQLDLTPEEEEDLLAARRRAAQSAREITLDEWIAAGQACCGAEPDDDPPANRDGPDERPGPERFASG